MMKQSFSSAMKGKWKHFALTQIFGISGVLYLYAYFAGGIPLGSGSGLSAAKRMWTGLLREPNVLTLLLGLALTGFAVYSIWQLRDPKKDDGKVKPKRFAMPRRARKNDESDSEAEAVSSNRLQRLAAAARAEAEHRDQDMASAPTPAPAPAAVPVAVAEPIVVPTLPTIAEPAPPVAENDIEGQAMLAAASASLDDQSRALIRQSAQQAILFRQHVPPRFDTKACSWFGGQPLAGPDFKWPMSQYADRDNRPMTFMMQVDCSAIPQEARLGLMPDHGLIQLFMDISAWGLGDGFEVKWVDAEPSKMSLARMPKNMPPAYGDEAAYDHGWAKKVDDPTRFAYRLLPRWTFDPVLVKLRPDAFAEQIEDWATDYPGEQPPHLLWPGASEEILAAQGHEVAKPGDDSNPYYTYDNGTGTLHRPFDSFPHDWRAVQIAAGHVLGGMKDRYNTAVKRYFPDMTDEERDALTEEIAAEATHWFETASANAPFDAVDAETSDAVWNWLSDRNWAVHLGFHEDVVFESAAASLSHSPVAAARVPQELYPRIAYRRALAVNSGTGLFVRDDPRMLSAASSVQYIQEEMAPTHIMLFELSSGDGLGHRFGEGVFQFWITPDDLAARRFEKVVLTAEAY
jgi:Domain of unknown function (DUF1963)